MNEEKLPFISIVMINYNGLKYLKRTITPVLNLDYPCYELILVDNNSNDGSAEYIKQFKKIRLIQNNVEKSKNKGLNLAINEAIGNYILFLDNDVIVNNNSILKDLLNCHNKLERAGLITLPLINENEDKIYFYGEYLSYISFIKKNKRLFNSEMPKLNNKEVVGISGAAFFAKRDLFNQIGFFDDIIPFGGEDVDVGIRSIMHGHRNFIFSRTVFIHIGMDERNNKVRYRSKYFSGQTGLLLTIIKNYSLNNLFFSLCIFMPYQFLKLIKDICAKGDIFLVNEYIKIYLFIFKNFRIIIEKRKEIQSKRLIKRDIFLKIGPPEIV